MLICHNPSDNLLIHITILQKKTEHLKKSFSQNHLSGKVSCQNLRIMHIFFVRQTYPFNLQSITIVKMFNNYISNYAGNIIWCRIRWSLKRQKENEHEKLSVNSYNKIAVIWCRIRWSLECQRNEQENIFAHS